MRDVLIIGGGPAGGTAAIYAQRAGASVAIVAQDNGSLGKTDKIENYYGFAEPVSGKELRDAGKRQIERLGAEWFPDEVVALERKPDGSFCATGLRGTYSAAALVLATGGAHTIPCIEGLHQHEGQGVSHCAVSDAVLYRGKAVAVLGNGKYALHEAELLLPVASAVTLLTNGMPAPLQLPPRLYADERRIRAVLGEDRVTAIAFESGDPMEADGVFVALGVAGSDVLARKLGALTGSGRVLVNEAMATSVAGVFAAGDCTGGLHQIAKAVYEGAVAGMSAVAFLAATKQTVN